jgi:hypothetical protein
VNPIANIRALKLRQAFLLVVALSITALFTAAHALPGLLIIAGAALLYCLPLIVAYRRNVPNRGSVAVINVFLGWTFLGWIVALAMAARSVPNPR